MRKLTAPELAKVSGGAQPRPAHLFAKAVERYYGGHPSGDGLAVAATPPASSS